VVLRRTGAATAWHCAQTLLLLRARLWAQVLVGMVLGLAAGVLIGPSAGLVRPELGVILGDWLAFPGRLFLASIQMIVVPLVFASIIRGLAATDDPAQLRTAGLSVTFYFVLTTAAAAALGITLATTLNPGAWVDPGLLGGLATIPEVVAEDVTAPSLVRLPEMVVGLLPGNPLAAMAEGQMLQVVIFALVVGVALVHLAPDSARPLLDLLGSVQEVCMTVVRWAMRIAPLAVFGLMAQLASRIGLGALAGMAVYVLTVLLGLLLLLLGYLVLVRLFGGFGPLDFLRRTREVLLLAFSTSSSAAVMPLSIRTAQSQLNVRPSIAQFVIPLGATINMNGTALYQAVAAVFLAQLFGVEVSLAGMVLIVAMTVGASIGSPATPGVGIVILAMVVSSIGVPPAGIALIMGVDRILDMARTSVNVAGDLVASRLLDRWLGDGGDAAPESGEVD
jgi:Na+/H+-dicarboxylate symporter